VFVYGTLRSGERNHALLAGATRVGDTRTESLYTLRDLGTHPALTAGGTTRVRGELWSCAGDVLARLDAFESADDEYERRAVRLEGAARAEAWFAPLRAAAAPPIPSGDWSAHLDARAARMTAIAVDWSGDRTPAGQRRKLWCAIARGGALVELAAGRTREELVRELEARIGAERELALGLDFCFGLPAWHARALGCASSDDVWAEVARRGEEWLARAESPFWRARAPRAEEWGTRTPFRRTEGEGLPSRGDKPLSIYQLVGAQVGTGSLRGMPYLPRLRAAGAAIWPFDAARLPLVVELYPRVFTGPLSKRDANARALALEPYGVRQLPGALRRHALAGDDAFDAALSALGMLAAARELVRLPDARDAQERLEGRILRPSRQVWPDATQDSFGRAAGSAEA
jgi:gamma-glutamylcyclotransferase (GGCT)/AIG2-like uncharacterized protein YtfP